MIGTIQQANKSKSGKTLSIQVDNVWYTSKNWELEQSAGKRIIFEPSTQTFPDGGSCQWLNDYVFEDQSTTPATQAVDARMAQGVPVGMPAPQGPSMLERQPSAGLTPNQPVQVNKDALIGALALTKSITGTHDQVWGAFVYFYHKMEAFDPTAPF